MLQVIANTLTYGIFRITAGSALGRIVEFFIYDTLKILILLFTMISIIGFIRSFVSQKKIKSWITSKHYFIQHFAASAFGALTPFCSCSSIPLFLSFLKAGIPLGPTLSFLVTSPIINEYLVVLMFGFFGWKITAFYVASGMLIGIFTGMLLGMMRVEKHLEKDFQVTKYFFKEVKYKNLFSRIKYGLHEGTDIISTTWKWVVLGVLIGAMIHNYVPQELINGVLVKLGVYAVPLAVLLGVPMYGSCAAILPIAIVLFDKGVPLGTALAFMMAVSALSLPEAIILRRAMNLKLIGIFFGVVTLGIIFTGYLMNLLYLFLK